MMMPSRLSVVLELAADVKFAAGTSRAKRIEEMARSSELVKNRVLGKIAALRSRGADIEVTAADTIFPMLVVDTTQDVIDQLLQDPDIKRISSTTDIRACAT